MSYISLTSKAEYHNLEILETDFVRDSGTYTIKASNISGDKESNCEVRIEGSLKKSEKTASKEEADLKLKTDLNGVEEKRDSKIDSAGLEEKRDSKVDSAGLEEKRDSKVDSAGLEEKRDSKVDSAGLEEEIDLKSNPKRVDEKKQLKEDVIEIKGRKSSKRNAADEKELR
jgi:protein-tyrosine-phosphatase